VLEQLKRAEERYLQIEALLGSSDVLLKGDLYRDLMKEYNSLTELVEAYRLYQKICSEADAAKALLEDLTEDLEIRELARSECKELQTYAQTVWQKIETLMLPKDPNADKDVIVEIRGCAGGEEAALFAAVLYRMYSMYAAQNGYRVELLTVNPTELGGYKEIDFQISGIGAYSKFRFESGVHRVQRVPLTESQGRIQTSTATVAVLPVAEEIDVEINPADIVFETCKSSGAGGQHINKTESAVRILHKPSGIVVECQEERSQYKNRDKAMKMLRTKLYEIKCREQHDEIATARKTQVGTGDRSERIRTYNYPQGRVTDHRIGLTLHTLERFLNGDIDDVLDALAKADAAELLREKHQNND